MKGVSMPPFRKKNPISYAAIGEKEDGEWFFSASD
jgi:hypothetical protein